MRDIIRDAVSRFSDKKECRSCGMLNDSDNTCCSDCGVKLDLTLSTPEDGL